MTLSQPYEQAWRARAAFVSSKLARAHSSVHFLGDALEKGDIQPAGRRYHSARRAVVSVAREAKTLRDEQPPTEHLDEPVATGSALAINGASAATVALDVMVSSMVALAAAEDDDTTDVLVGAYVDAELVYAPSAAVVQAASHSHGSEMVDLKRGFDADGEVALRSRVVEARARVHDINEQVEAGFEQRTPPQQDLDVGAAVEVRNRFVGTWSNGFEVADHIEEGFLIRRVSDRAVLPEVISHDQIRSDSRN